SPTGLEQTYSNVWLAQSVHFQQLSRMNVSRSQSISWFSCLTAAALAAGALPAAAQDAAATPAPEIRTPPAPHTPRINGAEIFGVRPDHPFLYHLPTTGDRPVQFSADKLPEGLKLDAATGNITGSLHKKGTYNVVFHANNSLGAATKNFKIVVGET